MKTALAVRGLRFLMSSTNKAFCSSTNKAFLSSINKARGTSQQEEVIIIPYNTVGLDIALTVFARRSTQTDDFAIGDASLTNVKWSREGVARLLEAFFRAESVDMFLGAIQGGAPSEDDTYASRAWQFTFEAGEGPPYRYWLNEPSVTLDTLTPGTTATVSMTFVTVGAGVVFESFPSPPPPFPGFDTALPPEGAALYFDIGASKYILCAGGGLDNLPVLQANDGTGPNGFGDYIEVKTGDLVVSIEILE